jgi:hypothetical protein
MDTIKFSWCTGDEGKFFVKSKKGPYKVNSLPLRELPSTSHLSGTYPRFRLLEQPGNKTSSELKRILLHRYRGWPIGWPMVNPLGIDPRGREIH